MDPDRGASEPFHFDTKGACFICLKPVVETLSLTNDGTGEGEAAEVGQTMTYSLWNICRYLDVEMDLVQILGGYLDSEERPDLKVSLCGECGEVIGWLSRMLLRNQEEVDLGEMGHCLEVIGGLVTEADEDVALVALFNQRMMKSLDRFYFEAMQGLRMQLAENCGEKAKLFQPGIEELGSGRLINVRIGVRGEEVETMGEWEKAPPGDDLYKLQGSDAMNGPVKVKPMPALVPVEAVSVAPSKSKKLANKYMPPPGPIRVKSKNLSGQVRKRRLRNILPRLIAPSSIPTSSPSNSIGLDLTPLQQPVTILPQVLEVSDEDTEAPGTSTDPEGDTQGAEAMKQTVPPPIMVDPNSSSAGPQGGSGVASDLISNPEPARRRPLYACGRCTKTFKSMEGYRMHFQAVHLQIRFQCQSCSKLFNTRQAYMDHYLAQHQGFRFECDICGKTYSLRSTLSCHRQTAHFGRRYKCRYCPRTFPTRCSRSYHVNKSGCEKEKEARLRNNNVNRSANNVSDKVDIE